MKYKYIFVFNEPSSLSLSKQNDWTKHRFVWYGQISLYWFLLLFFFSSSKQPQQLSLLYMHRKSSQITFYCVYSGQWFIIVIFKCCVQIQCDFIANMFHSDRVLDFFPVNFNFLFIACCSIYNYTYTSIYICDF